MIFIHFLLFQQPISLFYHMVYPSIVSNRFAILSIQCLSGPEKAISSVKSFDVFNIVLSIVLTVFTLKLPASNYLLQPASALITCSSPSVLHEYAIYMILYSILYLHFSQFLYYFPFLSCHLQKNEICLCHSKYYSLILLYNFITLFSLIICH